MLNIECLKGEEFLHNHNKFKMIALKKQFYKFGDEFKKFALKANFLDMAVGIIIGMSFNKVMNSFVKDLIMPFFSLFTDYTDFGDLTWKLRDPIMNGDVVLKQEVVVHYGKFLEYTIDFLVIALVLYFVVKGYNLYKSRGDDPDDTREKTPKDIELLNSINNELKKLNKNSP